MKINLRVRFYTKRYDWLCFTHAAQLAVLSIEKHHVEVEVDEYGDYYLGPTECVICREGGEK